MVMLLPDVDVWLRAFSRQDPDPLVVHDFSRFVTQRRIVLVGLVRQALLARTRNARQFSRVQEALAGFPDLPLQPRDHVRAATLIQNLRTATQTLSPWQALLWSVAERIQGTVWSNERLWQNLRERGCPVA
jgi:hypothetical protein